MSDGLKIGLAVAGVAVVGYFVLGSSAVAAVTAAVAGPLASPLGSSPGAVPPPIPAAGLAGHSLTNLVSDGGAAYNAQALAAGYPAPPTGMIWGQDGVTGQPVLVAAPSVSPFGLAHAALQSMTPSASSGASVSIPVSPLLARGGL